MGEWIYRSTFPWPWYYLVSGQLHASAALPPGKQPPGTHWIGGWVGPRAGVDDMEKRKFLTLPGLELWPLGRPARSQSLYQLPKGFPYGDESRVGYSKFSRHVYCTRSIPELIAAVREIESREESRRCRLRYEWPRVIPEVAVGDVRTDTYYSSEQNEK
jgi:hypothetical protein